MSAWGRKTKLCQHNCVIHPTLMKREDSHHFDVIFLFNLHYEIQIWKADFGASTKKTIDFTVEEIPVELLFLTFILKILQTRLVCQSKPADSSPAGSLPLAVAWPGSPVALSRRLNIFIFIIEKNNFQIFDTSCTGSLSSAVAWPRRPLALSRKL